MKDLDRLPDSEVVYRARRSKKCIDEDTGETSPQAYFLRKIDGKLEEGLSVCLASKCKPEECCSHFNKRYGVVSLEVSYIRSLGLEVLPDPLPEAPEHALIINVPDPYNDATAIKAEFIAGGLAKHSKLECDK